MDRKTDSDNDVDVSRIREKFMSEGRIAIVNEENAIDVLLEDLAMGEKAWDSVKGKVMAWRDLYEPELSPEDPPADGDDADEEEELSKLHIHDVARTTRWIVANVKEVFMKNDLIKLMPHLQREQVVVGYDQKIVNKIFDRMINKEKFFSDLVVAWAKDGTACVRVGWNTEIEYVDKEEFESMTEEDFIMKSQEKELLDGGEIVAIGMRGYCKFGVKVIHEDCFDMKLINLDDVRMDPRLYVRDKERCYFIEYQSTIADLIKNDKARDAQGKFSNVADIFANELPVFLSGAEGEDKTATDLSLEEYGMDANAFPTDFYRHPVTLVEGWDWIVDSEDGVSKPYHFIFSKEHKKVLLMERNDLPDNLPPIIILPFCSEPFVNYGKSMGALIGDYQLNRRSILRLLMNSAMLQTDNVKIVEADLLDRTNFSVLSKNAPGSVCVTKNPLPKAIGDSVFQLQSNPLDPMYYNLWGLLGDLEQDESGVTKYTQGNDASGMTDTASGISMIMNKAQKRLAELIYRLQYSLLHVVVKKAVLYAAAYMQRETFMSICGEDADFGLFQRQTKANFDINMSINFAGQDDFKINQYIQLLGVIKPFQDGGQVGGYFTNIILADIFELRGKEDFADEFRKLALASVQEERAQKQMQAMMMQKELEGKEREFNLKEREVATKEEKVKGELAKIASEMAGPVTSTPEIGSAKGATQ